MYIYIYMNFHIKPLLDLVKVSISGLLLSDVKGAQLNLSHPREVLYLPMRKLMSASEEFPIKLSFPLFIRQLFVPPVASVGLISNRSELLRIPEQFLTNLLVHRNFRLRL